DRGRPFRDRAPDRRPEARRRDDEIEPGAGPAGMGAEPGEPVGMAQQRVVLLSGAVRRRGGLRPALQPGAVADGSADASDDGADRPPVPRAADAALNPFGLRS